MSGEFGCYRSGYFHDQIDWAAEDLRDAGFESTRAWAGFFEAFAPVARAICWAEAADSSEASSIEAMIAAMPGLQAELQKVDQFLKVYRDIQRSAIERHLQEKK